MSLTEFAFYKKLFGGGSGGGKIGGTAIPVGQPVERIYFNIHNTIEETNALLSQLTYTKTDLLDHPGYPIFAYIDPEGNGYTGLFIVVVNVTGKGYEIVACDNLLTTDFVYLYNSYIGDTSNGWSYCDTIGDITSRGVPATAELDGIASADAWQALPVGAENEKIKDVLSITPFVTVDGYDEGVAAGKQAEHDAFWDAYQQNGSSNYSTFNGVFSGMRFNTDNFFPKYDIKPVGSASYLFYAWEMAKHAEVLDLKQRLKDCGVVLDTSGATDITNMFSYSSALCNIPTIDCTGLTGDSQYVFANMWTENKMIEKLIVNDTVTYSNWFLNSTGLVEIRFEGVIGHDIAFAGASELSTESVQSIIGHLKDLTGATAQTLTFHSDVKAKLTEEQIQQVWDKNWALG